MEASVLSLWKAWRHVVMKEIQRAIFRRARAHCAGGGGRYVTAPRLLLPLPDNAFLPPSFLESLVEWD